MRSRSARWPGVLVDRGQQRHELVAADPVDGVERAQLASHPARDLLQHGVADGVARARR